METQRLYIIKGDANCDGKIDLDDVVTVHQHVLGLETLTGDAFIAADVNNDGVVDDDDVQLIIKHNAGLQMIVEVVEK